MAKKGRKKSKKETKKSAEETKLEIVRILMAKCDKKEAEVTFSYS